MTGVLSSRFLGLPSRLDATRTTSSRIGIPANFPQPGAWEQANTIGDALVSCAAKPGLVASPRRSSRLAPPGAALFALSSVVFGMLYTIDSQHPASGSFQRRRLDCAEL